MKTWLTNALALPGVRRGIVLALGVVLGLVTEQVASLDVLPPAAEQALRALVLALSGS